MLNAKNSLSETLHKVVKIYTGNENNNTENFDSLILSCWLDFCESLIFWKTNFELQQFLLHFLSFGHIGHLLSLPHEILILTSFPQQNCFSIANPFTAKM